MAYDNTKKLVLNRPGLFSPTKTSVIRQGGEANSVFLSKDDSSYEESLSLGSTSSFKYDIQGSGIKSTQQLNVDWSDFANHTFFNSAQVKTNVAFDKLVNEFPFDGTKKETEEYFDSLTGFEKWVYDRFPKNKGYLAFSGSSNASGDSGTYVVVKDLAGAQFPTLSKLKTGETVLDPGLNSLSIEFWVYPVVGLSTSQAIMSIVSGSANKSGYLVTVDTDGINTTSASISMMVVSGGLEDKVSMMLPKNKWSHVHYMWNRVPGINTIYGYVDNVLSSSSSMPIEFGSLNVGGTDMYIGSGSSIGSFLPLSTFSGALDELRIWSDIRTSTERYEFMRKPVFQNQDMRLYFKFNEPSGSNSNLVLDHSSNSIHGRLSSRALALGVREISSASFAGLSPMENELLHECPVLFPNVGSSVELRTELQTSASYYDEFNPNLITKLVPSHYFEEGMYKDSLETEEGDITEDLIDNGNDPGDAKLGGTQVLLSLLYTWAKFFDEMKLYIQAFSSLNFVDYDDADVIPNDFLSVFAKREGIDLPPLFNGTTIEQFVEGENLDSTPSKNILGLQAIQNQIWKRILINLQDVMKSKGTIHSIKAFIRSVGIDPDNNFRIREYGGPTNKTLSFSRENRFEVATMMDFVSGGLVASPALSGATGKVEPGWPYNGTVSSNVYTSGSFTYEGTYRFPVGRQYSVTQSLARYEVTSSSTRAIAANLLYISSSTGGTLTLKAAPLLSSSNYVELAITGANILDGSQWYISFGRVRNDDPSNPNYNELSSSYFLRAAKQNNGTLVESFSSASHFQDYANSIWKIITPSTFGPNTSGPHVMIGSSSLPINYSLLSGSFETAQDFNGRVGQVRFWSKYLTNEEWPEHVLYYRSVGVRDPRKNFNFVSASVSGSWNRLRADISTDQIVTSSDASGQLFLTDFTQNNMTFTGSLFLATSSVVLPERFYFSYLSPKIDEGTNPNKVRIRGYQSFESVLDNPWSDLAPVHRVSPSEIPSDSPKLSIDFSITDTLDQDIMTIFGSLDELNNILGDPELMFASSYKELEVIREVYFNKLERKINLKSFFEFYKWFDTNIGTFVEQLVPRKTKYLGTNYIIESHFLERSKFQYQFEDIYLGEDIRSGLKDTILLQLITGKFDKY